jgi:hypothetical protein
MMSFCRKQLHYYRTGLHSSFILLWIKTGHHRLNYVPIYSWGSMQLGYTINSSKGHSFRTLDIGIICNVYPCPTCGEAVSRPPPQFVSPPHPSISLPSLFSTGFPACLSDQLASYFGRMAAHAFPFSNVIFLPELLYHAESRHDPKESLLFVPVIDCSLSHS